MDKIFKQLYPGVDEKYLERAFERIEKDGCPADEDLMVWFGKLVAAEIIEDAIGKNIFALPPSSAMTTKLVRFLRLLFR